MPPRGRRSAAVAAAPDPANRQWRDRHQRLSRSVTGTPDRPRAASEAVPLPFHTTSLPLPFCADGKGGDDGRGQPDHQRKTNETPVLATRPTGRSATDPRTQCTTDARPPWQAASSTRRYRPSHRHAPARVQRGYAARPGRVPRRRRHGASAAQIWPKLGLPCQPIRSGTQFDCQRSAAVDWVGVVIWPLPSHCKRHTTSAHVGQTTRSLVQVHSKREAKATDRPPYRVSRAVSRTSSCKGL